MTTVAPYTFKIKVFCMLKISSNEKTIMQLDRAHAIVFLIVIYKSLVTRRHFQTNVEAIEVFFKNFSFALRYL